MSNLEEVKEFKEKLHEKLDSRERHFDLEMPNYLKNSCSMRFFPKLIINTKSNFYLIYDEVLFSSEVFFVKIVEGVGVYVNKKEFLGLLYSQEEFLCIIS